MDNPREEALGIAPSYEGAGVIWALVYVGDQLARIADVLDGEGTSRMNVSRSLREIADSAERTTR